MDGTDWNWANRSTPKSAEKTGSALWIPHLCQSQEDRDNGLYWPCTLYLWIPATSCRLWAEGLWDAPPFKVWEDRTGFHCENADWCKGITPHVYYILQLYFKSTFVSGSCHSFMWRGPHLLSVLIRVQVLTTLVDNLLHQKSQNPLFQVQKELMALTEIQQKILDVLCKYLTLRYMSEDWMLQLLHKLIGYKDLKGIRLVSYKLDQEYLMEWSKLNLSMEASSSFMLSSCCHKVCCSVPDQTRHKQANNPSLSPQTPTTQLDSMICYLCEDIRDLQNYSSTSCYHFHVRLL